MKISTIRPNVFIIAIISACITSMDAQIGNSKTKPSETKPANGVRIGKGSDVDAELVAAIESNNLAKIKAALDKGADPRHPLGKQSPILEKVILKFHASVQKNGREAFPKDPVFCMLYQKMREQSGAKRIETTLRIATDIISDDTQLVKGNYDGKEIKVELSRDETEFKNIAITKDGWGVGLPSGKSYKVSGYLSQDVLEVTSIEYLGELKDSSSAKSIRLIPFLPSTFESVNEISKRIENRSVEIANAELAAAIRDNNLGKIRAALDKGAVPDHPFGDQPPIIEEVVLKFDANFENNGRKRNTPKDPVLCLLYQKMRELDYRMKIDAELKIVVGVTIDPSSALQGNGGVRSTVSVTSNYDGKPIKIALSSDETEFKNISIKDGCDVGLPSGKSYKVVGYLSQDVLEVTSIEYLGELKDSLSAFSIPTHRFLPSTEDSVWRIVMLKKK